jgi:hypothetical protein
MPQSTQHWSNRVYYTIHLLDRENCSLASCEEDTLKIAKQTARDYRTDTNYVDSEACKVMIVNSRDEIVWDKPVIRKPMRRYTFTPYLPGQGPSFVLSTFETNKRDQRGCYYIRYVFEMVDAAAGARTVLFSGADFNAGPMHAIDSIGATEGLMTYLTLRPGDTDGDYFAKYTLAQLDYCSQHAESLQAEVAARWQDRNGNLKQRYRRS